LLSILINKVILIGKKQVFFSHFPQKEKLKRENFLLVIMYRNKNQMVALPGIKKMFDD
jgi:hypothetical protein